MSLATVASVIGIGAGGAELFNTLNRSGSSGGGSNAGGGATTYVPTGQGTSDQTFQQILAQMSGGETGAAGQFNPAIMNSFAQMMGVDPSQLIAMANAAGQADVGLAGQAGQGAGQLGNQAGVDYGNQQALMRMAGQQGGNAQNLISQASPLFQAGNQLYQTSLDPQNALKAQLQQQVTDASRAGTSARGIGMGAQASGIENQDVSNFLINWQNQQLQRQATGLQGMAGAYGQGSGMYGTAGNMMGQAGGLIGQGTTAGNSGSTNIQNQLAMAGLIPGYLQSAGSTPYNTQMTAAGQGINAANAAGGALNSNVNQPFSNTLASIIPYLYAGQGATNQLFGQQQTGLNNLTGGLGNLQDLLTRGSNTGSPWAAYPTVSSPSSGGGFTSGTGDGYDFGGS